jgi:hypothetical protein
MSKSDQPKFSQKAPLFISKSEAENHPQPTKKNPKKISTSILHPKSKKEKL